MILYCGVVRQEIESPGVCIDLLLYGGEADIKGDIYKLQTWETVQSKYPDGFTTIFIDGGIHNRFLSPSIKRDVLTIIRNICTDSVIVYGNHLFNRYDVNDVCLCEDPLCRNENVAFTKIPVKKYSMEMFDFVMETKDEINYFETLRCNMEYKLKF